MGQFKTSAGQRAKMSRSSLKFAKSSKGKRNSKMLAKFNESELQAELERIQDLDDADEIKEAIAGLMKQVKPLQTVVGKPGRKPSGKTIARFVRKANTAPKTMKDDTGPGAGKGTKTPPPSEKLPVGAAPKAPGGLQKWKESVEAMTLPEFVEAMHEAAEQDSATAFGNKVRCMTEAYYESRSKDWARRITHTNPLIKETTGKGISLDLPEGEVTVTVSRDRLNEAVEKAEGLGIAKNARVSMTAEAAVFTLQAPDAAKLREVLAGKGVQYNP